MKTHGKAFWPENFYMKQRGKIFVQKIFYNIIESKEKKRV